MRNIQRGVTTRITDALTRGTIPWKQPWSSQGSGAMPRNAITNRSYSGANVPLLWLTAQERSYQSPLWLTYKQATEAGGNVRKGEKSTVIIYVNHVERERDGETVHIPFLKTYLVFNVIQCNGLDALKPASHPINEDNRDEIAEAFVASTGADIRHTEARAYYARVLDYINLPPFETFKNRASYYSTAFHELSHWTGAKHRLDRTKGKRFGDEEYSYEELVAELASAFICAEFGYDNDTIEDTAAYIEHWSKFLKNHDTAFISAASSASTAVEYMRSLAITEAAQQAA
jgi:antirestriction protein ArdC